MRLLAFRGPRGCNASMQEVTPAPAAGERTQRAISLALIALILGLASALCWMLGLNHQLGPDAFLFWLLLGLPWAGVLLSLGYLLRYGSRGRRWPWFAWCAGLLLALSAAAVAAYVVALGSAWQN